MVLPQEYAQLLMTCVDLLLVADVAANYNTKGPEWRGPAGFSVHMASNMQRLSPMTNLYIPGHILLSEVGLEVGS